MSLTFDPNDPPLALPEILDARRIALQPGDRLILSVAELITAEQADRLAQHIRHWAGSDIPVMVLPPGFEFDVVSPAAEFTAADGELVRVLGVRIASQEPA